MRFPLRRPPVQVEPTDDLTARDRLVQMARLNRTSIEVQGHVMLTRIDGVMFFTVLDDQGVA